MLSTAELEAIGAATPVAGMPTKKSVSPGEWRLDGIIYKSESDWTVWLNGDMYRPDKHPTDIKITRVSTGEVELVRHDDDGEENPIRLCIGQCGRP